MTYLTKISINKKMLTQLLENFLFFTQIIEKNANLGENIDKIAVICGDIINMLILFKGNAFKQRYITNFRPDGTHPHVLNEQILHHFSLFWFGHR